MCRATDLRPIEYRATDLRLREVRTTGPRPGKYRAKGRRLREVRQTDPRETGVRQTEAELTDPAQTDFRATGLRASAIRATGPRMREAGRTDLQETDMPRGTADRKAAFRIIAVGITAAMVTVRMVRAAEQSADNSSQEEAMGRMPEHRETDRADFRDLAGRALAAVRLIGAVRVLVRALTVTLTAARVIIVQMEDREPDSEIISQVKASLERLRQKIWKRSARKIRDVRTARRKANVPGRTISMRRTKL